MSALSAVVEMPKPKLEPKERRKRGEGRIFKQTCRDKKTGALVEKSPMWWIQYYSHGRQVRESSGSEKSAVAERQLRKRLGEAAAGVLPPARAERVKYEDLRAALLDDYQTNERKWLRVGKDGQRYISSVDTLDGFFAGFRAANITTDRLREFTKKRQEEGAANGTINRSLALLRRMFNLAVQDGKLRDVPFFPMLPEAKPRRGTLEGARYQELHDALPEYLRPALVIGHRTGMRLGEVRNLEWKNINFQESAIRLFAGETKNNEERIIPIEDDLRTILQKQFRERAEGCPFVCYRKSRTGAVQIGDFRKVWHSTCSKLGLGRIEVVIDPKTGEPKRDKWKRVVKRYSGLNFHDLRRTFVTDCENAGVPRHEAMAMSGHKTESVYKRYAIGNTERRRAEISRLSTWRNENRERTGRIEDSGAKEEE